MDRSRSRDLALRGSRELYYGSPATTRSTPVINRRRPVLLMIHYDELRFMAHDAAAPPQ